MVRFVNEGHWKLSLPSANIHCCPKLLQTSGFRRFDTLYWMVKKARQSATEQIPAFREHTFACPYCDKPTTVLSPMDHIFMKRPRCENCGKEFLIREHRAEKLRQ